MREKIIELGNRRDDIRAIVLTSTRSGGRQEADIFSDFDAELYVTDVDKFIESDEWFEELGEVLVVFREDYKDPLRETPHEGQWATRLVQYVDGGRIDFQVAEVKELVADREAEKLPEHLDVGYEVLLDKDGITEGMKPPSYRAHIPKKPTREEYARAVNNFWWNSTYLPKFIWRGDLMPAKAMLGGLRLGGVCRMLEWAVEIEKDWNWKPGVWSKGLQKVLDEESYEELAETFGSGKLEEAWGELFRIGELFRKTAIKVAEGLGYEYLYDLDRRVMLFLKEMQQMNPANTTRQEMVEKMAAVFRQAGK